ncbi:uncharacterized protein EHS24_007315 [Apiotrichum porosum]|uniref:Uncharacterized protein n=1 Tax=Apiotrichum porosum TaxID=105984 RepID=A0A427XU39_9TREE|nr:uncharacterized protein EHS24_007315 [Apiotrichum porosum]RSH82348.1 hypothetical protein EHS24_007315 [Apiotrichum porosum]
MPSPQHAVSLDSTVTVTRIPKDLPLTDLDAVVIDECGQHDIQLDPSQPNLVPDDAQYNNGITSAAQKAKAILNYHPVFDATGINFKLPAASSPPRSLIGAQRLLYDELVVWGRVEYLAPYIIDEAVPTSPYFAWEATVQFMESADAENFEQHCEWMCGWTVLIKATSAHPSPLSSSETSSPRSVTPLTDTEGPSLPMARLVRGGKHVSVIVSDIDECTLPSTQQDARHLPSGAVVRPRLGGPVLTNDPW